MPNNWKTYKLSDIGTIARGKSKHRPRDASHLYGGEFPFIQTGDVKGANHRLNNHSQTYSEAGLAQSKLWPKDTMCITIAANIAETTILNYPACFPDSIIGFIADKEKCDIEFVEYLMQHFKKEVQSHSIGSVQDNINLATFERINFLIPPLQEQKSIASILSAIDDKIENNLSINKTLEEMAMALYKHWFVDFGPFQDGEFVESELGGIPKGWEVKSLGSIISVLGGYAFKSAWFKDTGVKVLKIKNINNNIVDMNNCTCISEEISKIINPKFRIVKGDFLIAMTGAEVGKVGAVPDYGQDLWLNQRVGKLIDKDLKNASILIGKLLQTIDFYKVIQGLAYGSAQPNISTSDIEGIKIVLPEDKTILNKIIDEFVKSHDIIIQNLTENQTLTQLRDTLLPKLISGEVRLKEFRE